MARDLKQDGWARHPLLREASLQYLQDILIGGVFLGERNAYAEHVDAELAQTAMQG